jgi:hypothetical protein
MRQQRWQPQQVLSRDTLDCQNMKFLFQNKDFLCLIRWEPTRGSLPFMQDKQFMQTHVLEYFDANAMRNPNLCLSVKKDDPAFYCIGDKTWICKVLQ